MRLPDFLTDRLNAYVTAISNSRPPDVRIGDDDKGIAYMERWHAIPRNRFFNIYVHVYHHDDDRILHSHPWWSLSICVRGLMREIYTPTADGANTPCHTYRRNVRKGDVVLRSTSMFHRLEIIKPGETATLFLTGPKLTAWYFACKRGLVHWREFGAKGGPLQGCGEDDAYPSSTTRTPTDV